MKLLVTGGCGFILSNFIRYILNKYLDCQVINLDVLTYAGRLENTKDFKSNKRYTFVRGDICDKSLVDRITRKVDYVVHGAASSHVDKSILGAEDFVQTNVYGTYVLLEAAKKYKLKKFLFTSTDEVYGSIKKGKFKETDPLLPNSPYSASKAGADLMCRAYFKTYNLPVLITRSSNNYGEFQFPEKLIPLFITNLLQEKKVPIYGNGRQIRDWLYVLDNCSGIDTVLHKGKPGGVYNIGGNCEKQNIEITKILLKKLGKDSSWIEYVKDRPGHDFRYALDCSKIKKELGWEPKYKFNQALEQTVDWYRNHQDWWKRIKSGEYLKYYRIQYGRK
ncbi:dTDP-glucose 4,6-dehydratase [Patescibacteria group bacterium]|nr:dTDP-glucose 4,6-dehydratase [Patescibacteria group bacterium]